jgi:hypothetical protein
MAGFAFGDLEGQQRPMEPVRCCLRPDVDAGLASGVKRTLAVVHASGGDLESLLER